MINWERAYYVAIKYMGGDIDDLSMPALKRAWKTIRKEQKAEGIELPRVQTVYKTAVEQGYGFDYEETPRNEDMETEPSKDDNWGYEYIEDYKKQIEIIYQDTIAWMDRANDSTQEKQREYLAKEVYKDSLTASYYKLLETIDALVLQYGYDVTAQAIASDAEIEYTIALVFMPPSEFMNMFDMTISQLQAIMERLARSLE